jgi:hypothetical protein
MLVKGNPRCDTLVLLVGSNTLPDYLAAATARPRRAILVFSRETEAPKDRLVGELQRLGMDVEERLVGDAYSARDVATCCALLPPGAHLDYTGGTKVMAAQARLAFGGPPAHASYVDERVGLWRLDDGTSTPLCVEGLDLDLCCRLHGTRQDEAARPRPLDPTPDEAREIASAVVDDPSLVDRLYAWSRLPIAEARDSPLTVGSLRMPGGDWEGKDFKHWQSFLGGTWLDLWTRCVMHEARPDASVRDNIVGRLGPDGRRFQLDVAAIRGHRLYAVSCTTDRKAEICKLKAFEVSVRARQLGGDLARWAVACLAESDVVEQIAGDIETDWVASNQPRVFGIGHLREWHAGDLRSLAEWMED